MALRHATLVLAALLGSCVAYNDECTPVVADPQRVVGKVNQDLSVARADVRSDDTKVGQIITDAFLQTTAEPDKTATAHVATINGGDIRDDGVCGTKLLALPRGPVSRKDLRTVLPFDNAVYLVALTPAQLKNVLEHAYSRAGQKSFPPGSFFQISGVRVDVDCSKPAEVIVNGARTQTGNRIQGVTFCDGSAGQDAFCTKLVDTTYRTDGATLGWTLGNPPATGVVRMLCTDFVLGLGQNDGYVDLSGVKNKPCDDPKNPTNMPCLLKGNDLGQGVFNAAEAGFLVGKDKGYDNDTQDRITLTPDCK
jgi:hypothetical protein